MTGICTNPWLAVTGVGPAVGVITLGASVSRIVRVALFCTGASVAPPVGWPSVIPTVVSFATAASGEMGTVTARCVTPGPKVSVPEIGT